MTTHARGRTRRSATVIAILTAVTAVATPAVAADPTPSPAPQYQEYVSLGDSWSADVVILGLEGQPTSKYAPIDCFQATNNYPKQVAKALKVPTFRDATCGSATTDDFTQPQSGLPLGGTNPPQFDRLSPTTDLVTVGIGGNDAGVAGAATGCINLLPALRVQGVSTLPAPLGGSCKEALTAGGVDKVGAAIVAAEDKVVHALEEIHRISPNARVLVVNYLAAVPPKHCYPYVPILPEDMPYLYEKFNELNAMVARAAARGGAELVDTYTPTLGHDVCKSPLRRYVEAVIPVSVNGPAVAVPAHPNSAGANAQARIVLAAIRG